MNIYDEKYLFRIALNEDKLKIQNFLRDHWNKNHIMVKDDEYFDFEFKNLDHYNFILAINKNTLEVEGLLGFILASNTEGKRDAWSSLWEVNENNDNIPLLGVELRKRVIKLANLRYFLDNGLNPITAVPLVRSFLKRKVAKLQHFYKINANMKQFEIASIRCVPTTFPLKGQFNYSLKKIKVLNKEDLVPLISEDSVPYKDSEYYLKKFDNNPRRVYLKYGIYDQNEQLRAIIFARECMVNSNKALRIVDYCGDQSVFSYISSELGSLMKNNDYEYIDFYTYGFCEKAISEAGFSLLVKNDSNIIPNYFEPFEKKNVDIWCGSPVDNTLFYKADGDQDRANTITLN